jgi:hypothetical protein
MGNINIELISDSSLLDELSRLRYEIREKAEYIEHPPYVAGFPVHQINDGSLIIELFKDILVGVISSALYDLIKSGKINGLRISDSYSFFQSKLHGTAPPGFFKPQSAAAIEDKMQEALKNDNWALKGDIWINIDGLRQSPFVTIMSDTSESDEEKSKGQS